MHYYIILWKNSLPLIAAQKVLQVFEFVTWNETKQVTKAKRFGFKSSAWHLAVPGMPGHRGAPAAGWTEPWEVEPGREAVVEGTDPAPLQEPSPSCAGWTHQHPEPRRESPLRSPGKGPLGSGCCRQHRAHVTAWFGSPQSGRGPPRCTRPHPTPPARPVTSVSILAQNFSGWASSARLWPSVNV